MATRLRKLRIDAVALVPRGANQEARVLFYKAATKREQEQDFPASAFAYVPDPTSPSTWKLRLVETPGGVPTAAQVGRAVAALGPGGFRGQRVQIPAAALAAVKRKVLAAWRATHEAGMEVPTVLQQDSVVKQEPDEHQLQTLEERQQERQLWTRWTALWDDFCTTVWHILEETQEENQPYAEVLMTSIDQFRTQAAELLTGLDLVTKVAPLFAIFDEIGKAGAVISGARTQRLQEAIRALQALLDGGGPQEPQRQKGPLKMTETLESVTKRAEIAEARIKALETELTAARMTPEEQEADYLKSLPAAMRKRYEDDRVEKAALREQLEIEKAAREKQEYLQKSAAYPHVGIGAPDWELLRDVDTLPGKSRDRLLQVLKSANEVIRQSQLLRMVGKDGPALLDGDSAEARAMALAKLEQDRAPGLSFAAAIEKVWKADPALYAEYSQQKRAASRVA